LPNLSCCEKVNYYRRERHAHHRQGKNMASIGSGRTFRHSRGVADLKGGVAVASSGVQIGQKAPAVPEGLGDAVGPSSSSPRIAFLEAPCSAIVSSSAKEDDQSNFRLVYWWPGLAAP
jgi:hypothetical protein